MNIFEALEKGHGKATLPMVYNTRYATRKLVWKGAIAGLYDDSEDTINEIDLKRNDWIPYVPRETKCSNCEAKDARTVLIKKGDCYVCYVCGRKIFNPEVPRDKNSCLSFGKTKHREVFENVVWIDDNSRIASSDVYPHCLDNSRAFKPFKDKKCTKVTVEWEQ